MKAWQDGDGGAAEQNGDALGADLGLSGAQETLCIRHLGVSTRLWGALKGLGTEKEGDSVLGQLSRCLLAERAAKEAGSS